MDEKLRKSHFRLDLMIKLLKDLDYLEKMSLEGKTIHDIAMEFKAALLTSINQLLEERK